MVAKQGLVKAKESIEKALDEFIHHRSVDRFDVFENEWGHLEAVLGVHTFKDMNLAQRQDTVWKFLRKSVDPEDLVHLSCVHTLDRDEFDERFISA